MNLKSTFNLLLFVLLFGITANQLYAQVNVKMIVNTSTNLDTLKPEHIVLVQGESSLGTTPAITWDNTTGISATNIGGDYWEAEFQAQPGDTIRFKFVTYFAEGDPTFHWDGWEGPITGVPFESGGNRVLVVGSSDTTLPVQYYHGWEDQRDQYWRPFENKQDSIAVYFRVNMGGSSEFNPETGLVDVRGGFPLGGEPDWITINTLSREVNSVNGGSFFSGVAYVHVDSITAGDTEQLFKFVIQPGTWENVADRSFTFSGTNDTTIHWYYFDDRAPSGPAVTADLLFRLKLDALELTGLFDASLGDRVAVTGAKGWPPAEWDFDTEPSMLKMTYNADLEEWNLVESFTRFPSEIIVYKYYIAWDTSRVDSTSPNYIPGLDLENGWEEPGVTGGADRTYIYTDQAEQFLPGDFGEAQQFFNSLDPRGVITAPISITFAVDMTPATDVGSNPTNPLFRPGIDTAFIQFDGSMVPITQGLPMYGAANRIMLSDGDGDLIYTGTWDLDPPTFYQLCFHVVYTSTSGDIENGGGVQRGRRYYQYIHPSSVNGTIEYPATFELPELAWMNDSLTVEDPPDFLTSIDGGEFLPSQYSISQNYPNPFNPVTRIQYHIPEQSLVKLQVYDVTGRLVKVLQNKEQDAGTHILSWNGVDESGKNVASGVYFVRIQAGTFNEAIKMMLLK